MLPVAACFLKIDSLLCENRHSSRFTLDRWDEFEMGWDESEMVTKPSPLHRYLVTSSLIDPWCN